MAASSAALFFSCDATNKIMSRRNLTSQPANIVGKKKEEETLVEFNIHSAGVKKNTNHNDLRKDKPRGERLCVTLDSITYETEGFDKTWLCKV